MYRLIIAITSAGVLGTEEDLDAITINSPQWLADWRELASKAHRDRVVAHGRAVRMTIRGD